MVNYSRMEDVWRSYGPLDPIGPSGAARKHSRSKRIVVLGLAAVCGVAAALGLYLRPDLSARPVEAASSPPPLAATVETPTQYAAVTPRMEVLVSEPVDVLASGGPLPSDTVPPSAAPATYEPMPAARAPVPGAAPRTVSDRPFRVASVTPLRAGPAAVARPAPIRPPTAPAAEMRVQQPRVAPAVERPMVLARREDPPVVMREVPAVRDTPSFDCSRARGAGQQTVCSDPTLTALDRQMAAELALAMAAGHDRGRLQLDQDSWAARREAAAPDPDAVADAYRRRIRQLRSMR